MRDLQNTGNTGYANSRMLDGVFNSAIGFCFSIAPRFTKASAFTNFQIPRYIRTFGNQAAYRVAQAPTATGSGRPGFQAITAATICRRALPI